MHIGWVQRKNQAKIDCLKTNWYWKANNNNNSRRKKMAGERMVNIMNVNREYVVLVVLDDWRRLIYAFDENH